MPAIDATSATLEGATPHRDDYRRLLEQRRTHTAREPAHRVAFGGHGRTHQTAARHRHAAADRARQRARITTRRHG